MEALCALASAGCRRALMRVLCGVEALVHGERREEAMAGGCNVKLRQLGDV